MRLKGQTYPMLTCVNCGEEKRATRFPKRGGPSYEDIPATDPRRYDSQCKKCKKPAKPGQDRDDVKEPVEAKRSSGNKLAHKKKKAKARAAKPKLTPAQYKQKVRKETRIKSMIYLAEKGCENCDERDPRKLEYDHKEPDDKSVTISRLIINGYSWSAPVLRAEIRKCRILCANCHRQHTVEQQGYYANDEIQSTLGELAARFKFKL